MAAAMRSTAWAAAPMGPTRPTRTLATLTIGFTPAPGCSTAPEMSVTVYNVTNVQVNAGGDRPELTIDELARGVGMSVRNLREWRALGLLPAPEMRGRVGYYDPSQVDRL